VSGDVLVRERERKRKEGLSESMRCTQHTLEIFYFVIIRSVKIFSVYFQGQFRLWGVATGTRAVEQGEIVH